MIEGLRAGSSAVEITPRDSQFLFGYPHVKRYSTGVHDPLFSSALYLSEGDRAVMFIANDIIYITKAVAERVRARISEATGMPSGNIMITATHTHSGPIVVSHVSNEADPAVPKVDGRYVEFMEGQMVEAAVQAHRSAELAELGLAVADGTNVGTNRRDPRGPADPQVPVLMVRTRGGKRHIACMMVYSMHPTVLHEDSTLVSADYLGATRAFLQEEIVGKECPVLCHTGPAGNQSPRHVTSANTFAEAERLGVMLGRAVAKVVPDIVYTSDVVLDCRSAFLELPARVFPTVDQAEAKLQQAEDRLEQLRRRGAPREEVRTAECDWFGAEETLTLARADRDGRLATVRAECMPAEVQIIRIGDWRFVGWPGEIFVEYALTLKATVEKTYVMSLANGEFQGYIVTEEAWREGGYEASNSLFSYEGGDKLIETTLDILGD